MSSPFPGMNPYLENPDLWSEVHHRLITAIAITISPTLRPYDQIFHQVNNIAPGIFG